MRIAYLTSRYPQVSHTFIQREVTALRRTGVMAETFAIRRAKADEVLSQADREEFARTTNLLPVSVAVLVAAHALSLIHI